MARVTKHTSDVVCPSIVGAGVALTIGQVQRAIDAGLGPLDNAADPIGHWQTYASLAAGPSRRLPEADEAAMALAVALFPCARLTAAVTQLGAITKSQDEYDEVVAEEVMPWALSADELVAEEVMTEAQSAAEDKSYGARIAVRLLAGSRRSGAPWPRASEFGQDVSAAKNKALHHLGRAQTVLAEFSEMAHGAPLQTVINSEDLAAVIGRGVSAPMGELVVRSFQQVFGQTDLLGSADRLVADSDPPTLARAVHAADALVPLFERLVVPVGTGRSRWQVVAVMTPLMLDIGGLMRAAADNGANDLMPAFSNMLAGLSEAEELTPAASHSAEPPHAPR
jgi:hypothetical protein